jgi:tetratricopeptide (TPR) repeat protein
VSQRMKQRPRPNPSPADIKARAERAAHEGRFQQALDLAKQLYAGDKCPAHQEFLFNAYLGRARQLRGQGQTRDAAIVVGNTLALIEGMPAWAEQVAHEYMACGQPESALKLVEWLPDAAVRGRVLAHTADAALQKGPSGREQLPEDLRPAFDRILLAFEQSHAGPDEAARATLQEIGLQSPFLEWKLLIRGLQAYYQGDDARALENWARLSVERLPYRLAAPLRFRIDSAFRAVQPPETQAALQKQADQLQGTALLALLRPLQAALASEDLRRSFRLADSLLPHLRAEHPDLERRLAACFYAAVVRAGNPKDVARYGKLFGSPADDREFHRLEALACERADEMESAHEHWQDYDRWVAAHPEVWGGQADRVRAMIWCRMAENAAEVPDADKLDKLPSFLREMAPLPKPLQPPADACFRRSLELAPDVLETHVALVHYHRGREEDDRAEAAARRLLDRFPDHVPTLGYLGERCLDAKKPAEALALFERAYQANPLERGLRGGIGVAHMRLARVHMDAKQFEQARAEYQTGLEFYEGENRLLPLCQWAVCEIHAGNPARADQLFTQAQELAGHPLPAALATFAEAVRSKFAANRSRLFSKGFRDALGGEPDARSAVLCLELLALYRGSEIAYRGQKTHENQMVAYLERIPKDTMAETLLERAGRALVTLQKFKAARTHAARAARVHPHNPWFLFLQAESWSAGNPNKSQGNYRVLDLLRRARTLAEDLPANPERDLLLSEIDRRLQLFKVARLMDDPFAMLEMLHAAADDEDGEDDEDAW